MTVIGFVFAALVVARLIVLPKLFDTLDRARARRKRERTAWRSNAWKDLIERTTEPYKPRHYVDGY